MPPLELAELWNQHQLILLKRSHKESRKKARSQLLPISCKFQNVVQNSRYFIEIEKNEIGNNRTRSLVEKIENALHFSQPSHFLWVLQSAHFEVARVSWIKTLQRASLNFACKICWRIIYTNVPHSNVCSMMFTKFQGNMLVTQILIICWNVSLLSIRLSFSLTLTIFTSSIFTINGKQEIWCCIFS